MLVIPYLFVPEADLSSFLNALREDVRVFKTYHKLREKSKKDKDHIYLLPIHVKELDSPRGQLPRDVVIVFNSGSPSLRSLDGAFLSSPLAYSKMMLLIAEASIKTQKFGKPFFIKIEKEGLRKINSRFVNIAIKRWRKNRIQDMWDYIRREVNFEFKFKLK